MTQIKNPTAPPPVDPALKAKVTFCVQGVISPLLANIYLHCTSMTCGLSNGGNAMPTAI
jgi:hypothetical protein